MSILSYVASWFSGNATGQKSGRQVGQPSVGAYEETPLVGPDVALQVSSVWACVQLLVENIASLPLVVYETDKEGRRTVARESLLYRVLHDMPNRRMTSQEFWEVMLLNLFLRGNAYARIQRNPSGQLIGLWPMSADQVAVTVADDGSLLYSYRYENQTFIYLESDVLHIRGMGNGVIGLSPLDFMRGSVGLAIKAQNHTEATFRKQARRPGILMSDSVLTKEQRDALRNNFGEIATGGQRELYILEAKFKFEPLGMTPADLQVLETRRFAVEDVARWFGVPSVLINDNSQSTTWGSGIQQIVEGFYKFKLRPQLERIEQALYLRVLTQQQRAAGMIAEFNFDALLRASQGERMDIYAKATQNGVKTRNECRKLENDPPLPGGDVLTAQTNLAPVDMLGKLQGSGSVDHEPIRQ